MQSADMAVVEGQEEIVENENVEEVAVNRAWRRMRKSENQSLPTDHIPRHKWKCMSMK